MRTQVQRRNNMIFPPNGTSPISPLDFIALEENEEAAMTRHLTRLGGYVLRAETVKIFLTCLKAGRPFLLEGPPGGGKTTLPEAVAKAFHLPMAYLQGMKEISKQEVLFRWDASAQNEYVRQAMSLGGQSFEEARQNQWKREFLDLGELVAGYDYTARTGTPTVIIVDEVDKLDDRTQDMLLQLLDRKHVVVPLLQPNPIVGITDEALARPIVFLTSNNKPPGISDPLRSRCYYHYLEPPTVTESIAIFRARVPLATLDQIRQTAKLLKAVQARSGDIKHPPQLREILAFLNEIVREKITELTPHILHDFACTLVKTQKDTRSFHSAAHGLSRYCMSPDPEIDGVLEADGVSVFPGTQFADAA